MPLPYGSRVISAPVDTVWSVVRQFGEISAWHPVISQSSFDSGGDGQVGSIRRLTLADGGVVVERLVAIDDDDHRLVYAILESPFPVRRYVSTMHLAPVTDAGTTFMEWFAEFDADAADEEGLHGLFSNALYADGLKALSDHVTG